MECVVALVGVVPRQIGDAKSADVVDAGVHVEEVASIVCLPVLNDHGPASACRRSIGAFPVLGAAEVLSVPALGQEENGFEVFCEGRQVGLGHVDIAKFDQRVKVF